MASHEYRVNYPLTVRCVQTSDKSWASCRFERAATLRLQPGRQCRRKPDPESVARDLLGRPDAVQVDRENALSLQQEGQPDVAVFHGLDARFLVDRLLRGRA